MKKNDILSSGNYKICERFKKSHTDASMNIKNHKFNCRGNEAALLLKRPCMSLLALYSLNQ